MTATFQKHEIEFVYPDNWKLIQNDDAPEDEINVQVESPSGAFWSLNVLPPDVSPAQAIASAVEGLKEQYQDFEIQDAPTWTATPHECETAEALFYCLDFLVTAGAWAFSTDSGTMLVLCQAENREYDQMRELFDAITVSLLKDA